jgi:hypothetical protein
LLRCQSSSVHLRHAIHKAEGLVAAEKIRRPRRCFVGQLAYVTKVTNPLHRPPTDFLHKDIPRLFRLVFGIGTKT